MVTVKFFNLAHYDYIEPTVDFDNLETATDLSSFRTDAEQVRALKFNPQGGSTNPQYDYPNGEIPKDDPVSDVIIAMRSGKLDKADIQRIRENILDDAKNDSDSKHADALLKAVDKALGIGENNSENNN